MEFDGMVFADESDYKRGADELARCRMGGTLPLYYVCGKNVSDILRMAQEIVRQDSSEDYTKVCYRTTDSTDAVACICATLPNGKRILRDNQRRTYDSDCLELEKVIETNRDLIKSYGDEIIVEMCVYDTRNRRIVEKEAQWALWVAGAISHEEFLERRKRGVIMAW